MCAPDVCTGNKSIRATDGTCNQCEEGYQPDAMMRECIINTTVAPEEPIVSEEPPYEGPCGDAWKIEDKDGVCVECPPRTKA